MAKVSELWDEVEQVFSERTSSALKMAIIEAHKILEAVLDSKKYPGRTVEERLYWAGYPLKGKNGLSEALEKHNEILLKFDYLLTNIESEDILKTYQQVINEIAAKPDFDITEQLKAFFNIYFSPKSVLFWKNLAILGAFFAIIKFLSNTQVGGDIVGWGISLANFVISWPFLVIVGVLVLLAFVINYYLANKSKIRIKE